MRIYCSKVPIKTTIWLQTWILTMALVSSSGAQTVTQSTREVPAPWRPAFGEVNQDGSQQTPATASNASPNSVVAGQLGVASGPGQAQQQSQNGASTSTANNSSQGNSSSGPLGEITPVSSSLSSLPNDAGQIWREYDIRRYTSQIKNVENPEKALVDWILLETGTEMWFTQPLGILNASRDKLYVYHTPEIHKVIKPIVDRFVYRQGELQNLEVNLVSVSKPNWRTDHYSILQPVEVPSPGVEAWMVSKENAALLLGQLATRTDFKKHGGGLVQSHDGQKFLLEKRSPTQFVRSVRWVPEQSPSYQPLLTQVNEGFTLDISCLSSLDGKSMEASIQCDVDQIERLTTVKINVPSITGGVPQKMSLQIPQLLSWRLRERIRWPADQVLLLNVGVVATPTTDGQRPLPGILGGNSQRGDALLFLEHEGPTVNRNLRHAAAGGSTAVAPVLPRR